MTSTHDRFEPANGSLPVEPTPTYDQVIAELADPAKLGAAEVRE